MTTSYQETNLTTILETVKEDHKARQANRQIHISELFQEKNKMESVSSVGGQEDATKSDKMATSSKHPLPTYTVYYSVDKEEGFNVFSGTGQPLVNQGDLKFVPVVKRFTIFGHLDSDQKPIHPIGTLMYTETLITKDDKVINLVGRATANFDLPAATEHHIPQGTILEWTNVSSDNALGLDSSKNFTSQGKTVTKTKSGHVNYSPTPLPKTGDPILVQVTTTEGSLNRRIHISHKNHFPHS